MLRLENSSILRHLHNLTGGFHRIIHIRGADGDPQTAFPIQLVISCFLSCHRYILRRLQSAEDSDMAFRALMLQYIPDLIVHGKQTGVRHSVDQHAFQKIPLVKVIRTEFTDRFSHCRQHINHILAGFQFITGQFLRHFPETDHRLRRQFFLHRFQQFLKLFQHLLIRGIIFPAVKKLKYRFPADVFPEFCYLYPLLHFMSSGSVIYKKTAAPNGTAVICKQIIC